MADVFLSSLDGMPFDGYDAFDLVPELSTAGAVSTSLRALVHTHLFTDRRAEDGDDLPNEDSDYRGGWWADTFESRPLGSRLWLLARASVSTETLVRAKAYAEEALVAMVEDGLCASVSVRSERLSRHSIGLHVTLIRGEPSALRYAHLWTGDL